MSLLLRLLLTSLWDTDECREDIYFLLIENFDLVIYFDTGRISGMYGSNRDLTVEIQRLWGCQALLD